MSVQATKTKKNYLIFSIWASLLLSSNTSMFCIIVRHMYAIAMLPIMRNWKKTNVKQKRQPQKWQDVPAEIH